MQDTQQALASAEPGTKKALPDLSSALRWRCIGPHRGGRVVAVCGDPYQPMVFYFGACAGGVWKSTDGGTYWENVSDGFFKTAAVGALAVAPSDPAVIYAGTGETTIRGNVSHGDGVYRSTDAGRTWTNLGLADTRHIAKIRVHPHDPDQLYVAALGHAWGPNPQRGIFRSRDGGRTWDQLLFRSDRAGAIDLSMDPQNPRLLYAAFWEAQRTPYSLSSGGPGSSLYRSIDGGESWTELTSCPGLPSGIKGKIGVAVSPARPGRVWALVEALDGALFRSDDFGDSWQRLSEEPELRRRAWYYTHLYADPLDPETVWVLNLQAWRSTDGGQTFGTIPTPHGDNHDLWIDPRDPQRMIEGNDGGACVTFNGGRSWSTLYNQPTAQLYHVTTDTQLPYRVYGSQQDNSAISLPSFSPHGAITSADWYVPGGGESGYIAVRPDDPAIVFGGAIGSGAGNGRLLRHDHRSGQERNITVWPELIGMGDPAIDLKYRFQWTFPVVISPHDPDILYVAANRVLRSTNEGASWEPISPDLTRNDPVKLQASGGPITRDNTGAEVYCTIFSFAESPFQPGLFWAGTDDGLVHLSRDGGRTWQNITPLELPEWALISVIEPSPHDPAAAYLAATRYKLGDRRPYLFKTADYGQTWQSMVGGLPEHDFTRVVRADAAHRGVLYAGTETGLYVSLDDGGSWQTLQTNLPVAPIHDLAIKDHDLLAATHGRSFWVLDDLTPLHGLAAGHDPDAVRLFPPRPVIRLKVASGWGSKPSLSAINYRHVGPLVVAYRHHEAPDGTSSETLLDAGQNPPIGAIVTYYLPHTPEGEITLVFLDDEGQEIRRFSSKAPKATEPAGDTGRQGQEGEEGGSPLSSGGEGEPFGGQVDEHEEPKLSREAGCRRFTWDLRAAPARKLPGDKSTEELLAGPMVPPGRYQAVLTVGDTRCIERFEVLKDPRVTATQEDLDAQYRLLLAIRDLLSRTHAAILRLRDLREQLAGWQRRLSRMANAGSLREAIGTLQSTLQAVEDVLVQTRAASPLSYPSRLNEKLAALAGFLDGADAAPTQQAREAFADLSTRVELQLTRLEELIAGDLASLNARIRDAGVPAIVPAGASFELAG